MTEDKQNTPFPPENRRTEYVGAKVTPGQKQHIRRLAEKCGMTVSNYILARASGYRPKARLTARQEAVMETLIGCRSDLVNYTSALRGMNPEKRKQMFNSYPFMLEWLKELGWQTASPVYWTKSGWTTMYPAGQGTMKTGRRKYDRKGEIHLPRDK